MEGERVKDLQSGLFRMLRQMIRVSKGLSIEAVRHLLLRVSFASDELSSAKVNNSPRMLICALLANIGDQ